MTREGQPFGFDPRPDPKLSDRELVDQARKNPEAFGQLYDRYLIKVFSFHYARLDSLEAAKDATQDTFMSALSHLSNFQFERGDISFPAWLFRIAHNQDANEHRSRARKPITKIDEILESQLQSTLGDPEVETEANEEKRALRAAVQKLPYDQRKLVYLKFYADLSNYEISQVLGRTEGATKALLHRTIIKLRAELTDTAVSKKPDTTPKEHVIFPDNPDTPPSDIKP